MLSLFKNGVDDKMKVIGSKRKRPILVNTTLVEVDLFRNQVSVVDMIDCEDRDRILLKLDECYTQAKANAKFLAEYRKPVTAATKVVETREKDPKAVRLDKAGYFVIVPKPDSSMILVEHYSNSNELLRVVKGTNARDIYWTILENNWVTELSHAAYLGKELTIAEMTMRQGMKYVQDMA